MFSVRIDVEPTDLMYLWTSYLLREYKLVARTLIARAELFLKCKQLRHHFCFCLCGRLNFAEFGGAALLLIGEEAIDAAAMARVTVDGGAWLCVTTSDFISTVPAMAGLSNAMCNI